MNMLRRVFGMAIMIVALPLVVRAQAVMAADVAVDEGPVLAEPVLSNERARLQSMVDGARASGLPAEILIEKVREGVAKRVPAARITQAVTLLYERMQVADRLLALAPRAASVERRNAVRSLVDALNAGLTETDLSNVIANLGAAARDPKVVAEVAVTMAELSERGFARASVVRATTVAWQRGGVRAMPSVIAAAASIGPQVSARDAALEQTVTQLHLPPGLSHAPGQPQGSTVREPGPPHDDAFNKGQSRGRGNGKGPKP